MESVAVLLCLLAVASAWEPRPYGPPHPTPGQARGDFGFHDSGRGFDARSQTFGSNSRHDTSYGFDGPHSHVHVSTGFHDNHIGHGDFRDGPDHYDGPGRHFGPEPGVRYAPKTIVKEVEVPRVVYKEVPKYIVKEVPRYITKEVERVVIKEIPKTIVKEVEVPRIVVKEVPVTKTVVRERPVPKVVYKDVEVPHIVVRKIPKTIFKDVEVPHVQVNHVPVHHEVNIATPVVAVNRQLHVDDTPALTAFHTPYPSTPVHLGVATSTPAISIGGSLTAPPPVPVLPATPARAVYGPGKVVGSLTGSGYSSGVIGTQLTHTDISTAGLHTTSLGLGSALQPETHLDSYIDKK